MNVSVNGEPRTLPEGVTVGGVPVGNLLPSEAAQQIRKYFSTPLKLLVGKRLYRADPNAPSRKRLASAKVLTIEK